MVAASAALPPAARAMEAPTLAPPPLGGRPPPEETPEPPGSGCGSDQPGGPYGGAGAHARSKPRGPRPQMSQEEAAALLRDKFLTVDAEGGFVVQVPGGVYGGNGVLDRVLHQALQPGGDFDARYEEVGARCVAVVEIGDRCLSEFPIGHHPLKNLCRWLRVLGRLPTWRLALNEAWLQDEDVPQLIALIEASSGSDVFPLRLELQRNCFRPATALTLAQALARRLAAFAEPRRCILDMRCNWIMDATGFFEDVRRSVAEVAPSVAIEVAYCEDPPVGPPQRTELLVVAGPSWSSSEGARYANASYSKEKGPWSNFMAGPSTLLATELEHGGWTFWVCPLCEPYKKKRHQRAGWQEALPLGHFRRHPQLALARRPSQEVCAEHAARPVAPIFTWHRRGVLLQPLERCAGVVGGGGQKGGP